MKSIFLSISVFFIQLTLANQIDRELAPLIQKYNLQALQKIEFPKDQLLLKKIQIGARLFHDMNLSGNRNIACIHCHHPRVGTGDMMALSLGEGAQGLFQNRVQAAGHIIRRHSPPMINLGYDDITVMFYDGRVSFDPKKNEFMTPEPGLNGANPKYKEITNQLGSALAAQSIFPLLNVEEMKGSGDNNVAKAKTNIETWNTILNERILANEQMEYKKLLKEVFPGQKINIGHIGNAMAAFFSHNFNIVDTPYDRYLKGNVSALTAAEKRGFKVFSTKAQCIKCHNGPHLSNFSFEAVGVPQIGVAGSLDDKGRFEVTGNEADLYKFRTPPLRNIVLLAPYFHDGTMSDLNEVVNHFNNIKDSLENYDLKNVNLSHYNQEILVDKDVTRNKKRFDQISLAELKSGLKLTDDEKKDLLSFLTTGILDYRFQKDRN